MPDPVVSKNHAAAINDCKKWFVKDPQGLANCMEYAQGCSDQDVPSATKFTLASEGGMKYDFDNVNGCFKNVVFMAANYGKPAKQKIAAPKATTQPSGTQPSTNQKSTAEQGTSNKKIVEKKCKWAEISKPEKKDSSTSVGVIIPEIARACSNDKNDPAITLKVLQELAYANVKKNYCPNDANVTITPIGHHFEKVVWPSGNFYCGKFLLTWKEIECSGVIFRCVDE